jgi:AGCS family alanine or glycine:cation symporter
MCKQSILSVRSKPSETRIIGTKFTNNPNMELQHMNEQVGLDQQIDQWVGNATGWFVDFIFYQFPIGDVSIPWVLIPLILGAAYFTLYFSLPGFRLFGVAINTVRGAYEKASLMPADLNVSGGDQPDTIREEGHDGEVNHFQALTAALSATVGLGNIAGVAVAIAVGGPGATFWMILAGILGMSSKFVECTLGVKFRDIGPDGRVYGGPMQYLRKGLALQGMPRMGKILAAVFAVMCIGGSFGGGNMFQANQAAAIFINKFAIEASYAGTLFGLVMAGLVAIVIIGGIQRIAVVTEKIVPFMAALYVGAALIILVSHFDQVPDAISQIFNGAFTGAGITGGILGVVIQGFRRAAFSNEAGVGSSAIAHSAVKTKHPASEGVVALLEPFIDTVVICTMTAIVIVLFNMNGAFEYGSTGAGGGVYVAQIGAELSGVDLTSYAFDREITNFSYVLMIAVILFAFSTMISWSYYGLQAWLYLFGRSKTQELVYKVLFCTFVVVGAAAQLNSVLNFSDAMIFAMMVPNMIGLVLLVRYVKHELDQYLQAIGHRRTTKG